MPSQSKTFWRQMASVVGAHRVLRMVRFYPPYFGAGIRLTHATPDLRVIEVEMKLSIWNQNYVGTHFGGSLYSMCDPFYMLMVMEALGPQYVVWDKSATIDFLKPGRGKVRARFELSDERVHQIQEDLARNGKAYPRFEAFVHDEFGNAVAKVGKVLSIKTRRS